MVYIIMYSLCFNFRECSFRICRNNYGQGFTFIIQNVDVNIDAETVTYGSGLGYSGLTGGSLVIEFDFETDIHLNDPTYPHVSV